MAKHCKGFADPLRSNQSKLKNGGLWEHNWVVKPPTAGCCRSVHNGRVSFLKPLEDNLLTWFLQMREQGIMISTRLVVVKASQLSAEFRRKTSRSKDQIVRRFLASNKITLRSVTHTCQHPPDAVVDEAMSFIQHVREKQGCWFEPTTEVYFEHGSNSSIFWYANWKDSQPSR